MRCKISHIAVGLLLAALLTGCEDTTFRSAVPNRPVQLRINLYEGLYTHFRTTALNDYCLIDHSGYHYHDQTLGLGLSDYYGYAGVLVFVDMNGYSAYDLCCPHCWLTASAVQPDGMFAICPNCGEQYDLAGGYAVPQKGISHEALKRYTISLQGDFLYIKNQ